MKLMDFTSLPIRKKSYGGANGNKISVVINNELYMLKLPSHAPKNPNLSYLLCLHLILSITVEQI